MIPVLSLLLLVPALGAVAAAAIRDPDRARLVARAVALLTLAASAAIAVHVGASGRSIVELGPSLPGVHARWHLGADPLSAPFLPVVSAIAVAVLVAAPREPMTPRACAAMLLSLATAMGVYLALDLLLLTAFWMSSLVPGAYQMHRARSDLVRRRLARTYDIFLVLGSLPIVAATFVVAWSRARAGSALPFDLAAGGPLAPADQHLVLVLLALAIVIRKPIVPFHSWLPVLVERGPIGIGALVVGTNLGAYLVVRVVLPLLPDAAASDLPILAGVALVSALYAAFVGLAQTDLRRALGFVLTSELGLVLVGLAEIDQASMHGALLQMIAVALTATGLLLIAAAIEARTGTSDVARMGGLVARYPRMAAAFLLLGLGGIGFPGSIAFVAEDLLLNGLLDAHPVVATAMLVATVLNGVTVLRLFFQVFLGPARDPRLAGGTTDLRPREAAMVLGLLAAIVVLGVVPGPLLAMREESVRALAIAHVEHDAAIDAARR